MGFYYKQHYCCSSSSPKFDGKYAGRKWGIWCYSTHTLKIVIKCLYGNFLKTTSSQIIGSIIVNDVCFIWWNWVVTRSSHWHIFVSSQKIICLLHLASTFCVQRIFFLWKSKGTKNPCQMKIIKRLAHFSSWLSHTHVEIIDDILVLFILPDVDNCD